MAVACGATSQTTRFQTMTHEIKVRPARREEANFLSSLAYRAKAHWGYPAAWMTNWAEDLTITPDYIETHQVAVAELQGRVTGMCAMEDHGDHWRLEHVWIEPTEQRKGIGRRLVAEALSKAKAQPGKAVRLAADPNAKAFYAALGAYEVGNQAAPMEGAADRTLPLMEFRN